MLRMREIKARFPQSENCPAPFIFLIYEIKLLKNFLTKGCLKHFEFYFFLLVQLIGSKLACDFV